MNNIYDVEIKVNAVPVKIGTKVIANTTTGIREFTAKPACNMNSGKWYCVTHKQLFPHNVAKDYHVLKGFHRLAWACDEHGIEKP